MSGPVKLLTLNFCALAFYSSDNLRHYVHIAAVVYELCMPAVTVPHCQTSSPVSCRGQEIALMKDSRRKATIVCLQDTEFLVVDRDDFFDKGLHRHIQAEFEYKYNFFR